MHNLKTSKDEQSKLIEDAEKQERLLVSAVNESQAKLNKTLRQIQTIRSSTPKYTPSRGAVSVSSNAVVTYASNFLDTPYKWGEQYQRVLIVQALLNMYINILDQISVEQLIIK